MTVATLFVERYLYLEPKKVKIIKIINKAYEGFPIVYTMMDIFWNPSTYYSRMIGEALSLVTLSSWVYARIMLLYRSAWFSHYKIVDIPPDYVSFTKLWCGTKLRNGTCYVNRSIWYYRFPWQFYVKKCNCWSYWEKDSTSKSTMTVNIWAGIFI